MERLVGVAERFAVGELNSEDLTMVAADALARGLDCPSLVELACLHRSDCAAAPDLFRIVLAELGIDDRVEVGWERRGAEVTLRRAQGTADQVLAGHGDPYERCLRISEYLHRLGHALNPPMPELADLATEFEVRLVDWKEGYGDSSQQLAALRQGCRRLLDRPPL